MDLSKKNLLHRAPHVVNLAGLKWAIWAPNAHPYPARGGKSSPALPRSHLAGARAPPQAQVSSGSSEGEGGNERHWSEAEIPLTGDVALEAREMNTSGWETGQTDAEIPPLIDFSHDVDSDVVPPLIDLSHDVNSEVKPSTALVSSLSEGDLLMPTLVSSGPAVPGVKEEVPIDTSPYGFLERDLDPELLAELTVNVDESTELGAEGIEFQVDAFKRVLKESRTNVSDQEGSKLFELPEKEEEEPSGVTDKPCQGAGPSTLDLDMTPDEVLQELQKVKLESGGVLNTESLDPFLSYFGELSRRELERLESLEPKRTSSSSSLTGGTKRKRTMAIRFPGQSPPPPPDPYVEQYKKSMEAISQMLPEAPDLTNLSDSSEDEDGGCPKPFVREEYMRKALMDEGTFGSDDEEYLLGRRPPVNLTHFEPSGDALLPPQPLCLKGSDSAGSPYAPIATVAAEPYESAVSPGTGDHESTMRGSVQEGDK